MLQRERNGQITKLQREAALCTDELLALSDSLDACAASVSGCTDTGLYVVQCRVLLTQCRQIADRLKEIDAALDALEAEADTESTVGPELLQSVALTRQIILSDLRALEQEEASLHDLLACAGRVKDAARTAAELQDTTALLALRDALRKEETKCQSQSGAKD